MNSLNMPNYYQLLKLNIDAEITEVEESYKIICENFSIDLLSSREEIISFNKELVLYKDAFDTLSDTKKRKQYDENLKELLNQKAIDLENTHKNIVSETSDLANNLVKDSTIKFEINKFKEDLLRDNFAKGKEYLNTGQYHEAINTFRKLIDLKNKESKYHSYLALSLDKKGWHDYAEEEFKIAISLNPDDEIAIRYFEEKSHQKENKKTSFLVMSDNFEINSKKSFWQSFKKFLRKLN